MSIEQPMIVDVESPTFSCWESDELIAEQLATMLEQKESHYSPCFDYFNFNQNSQRNDKHVSDSWRRQMCQWAYKVTDHFGFDREVVSIAFNYIDRVMAHNTETTKAHIPEEEFQLVSIASLYLAIKLHGETDATRGETGKLRIEAFVELSRDKFSIETLEAMELSILSTLDWHVNPPTVISFIACLLRLLPESWDSHPLHASVASTICETARYLTELSVFVSSISIHFKPSVIAYAAILCAMESFRETLPLPYGARIEFLNHMANVTTLRPSTECVILVCCEIRKMCPQLFVEKKLESPAFKKLEHLAFTSPPLNTTESLSRSSSSSSDGGTGSPVCVSETPEGSTNESHKEESTAVRARKRTRRSS